jgi:SAM-dependent methyltransferase
LIDDQYILALDNGDPRIYSEGFMHELLKRRSKNIEVLELGCGEGRALGQMMAKFGDIYQLNGTCFNLKGYKRVKRGMAISGAVSSGSPAEIEKMLTHYNIHLPKDVEIPKVILGDASTSPWPFSNSFFDLIISQATLSKINEVDVVLSEVLKTLKPGGFAALGLGGTFKCGTELWQLPAMKRQLFCQQISINGNEGTVALTMKAPFDIMGEEQRDHWWQEYGKTYRGSMQTSVFISMTDAKYRSHIKCPLRSFEQENILDLTLRSCTHFTPAWNRGVRTLSEYLRQISEVSE